MSGKKLYIATLVFMIVLAIYGTWAMVDGAISYRQRPRIEEYLPNSGTDIASQLLLSTQEMSA